MSGSRIVLATLAVVLGIGMLIARNAVHAQSPTRVETGDAAVSALVAEVRALRADLAAASRNQLRTQMLLGRVQMQEQRLAYLDKQRSDAAAQAAMLAQMTSAMGGQVQGFGAGGCANMPNAEARRDCESQGAMLRRQLEEQEKRAQEVRAHERDLENAVAAEQARWSEFNSMLDELERALR